MLPFLLILRLIFNFQVNVVLFSDPNLPSTARVVAANSKITPAAG